MNLLTIVPAYVWIILAIIGAVAMYAGPALNTRVGVCWFLTGLALTTVLSSVGIVDALDQCPERGFEGEQRTIDVVYRQETEQGMVTWTEGETYCVHEGKITGRI